MKFFGGRCLNFNNETVLACASGNPESTNGKLCYATEDGEGNLFSFRGVEALSFDEERPSIVRKFLGWKRVGKTNKNHYNGDMARIVDEAIIIGEFVCNNDRSHVTCI